jgi:CheY-like chemotaxis protein
MNAILGIAQILMQDEDLPYRYSSEIAKIYTSGSNLLGIINDILDMTKIETGKMELNPCEYDTPSLINDAVQLNIVRIGSKPIEFLLDIDENLPLRLYGDELRLKQILNNLLSNGIKYTESGYVKLSVNHSEEEDGEVLLNFTVEDTGQGMKLNDREKFFSEYSRFNSDANRTTEGTGLGLSITKRLVEMMEGTIWVESEYGKGSVFMVMVKQKAVVCEAIGAALASQLSKFEFRESRSFDNLKITRDPMPYGRVLIVDDVETNLYVAKGLLVPYKLAVATANSGFEAIDLIKEGNTYDIIFMDHMMPQLDGIETTHRLRALGYKDTIVALTANALAGNDLMFMKNGFDGFISKPIDVRSLNAVLNKFVRDKQTPEILEAAKQQAASQPTPYEAAQAADAELLAIFARDAKKVIVTLSGILANITDAGDEDLRLYEINVHAMKSALANIGRNEASRLAEVLEQAGKLKNKIVIQSETQGFITILQELVASIDVPSSDDDQNATDSDPEFLHGKLQQILTACEEYDDLAVEEALGELKAKKWSQKTKELLGTIAEHTLHSNFEDAAGAVNEYLG